jgi:hypothetical protein
VLNVSFKFFTKVIANRLAMVASKVIGPSQSAFLPGRYILDGIVILHETLLELKRKKMDGVILKLDFEKAYGKVNWHFFATGYADEGIFRKMVQVDWTNCVGRECEC